MIKRCCVLLAVASSVAGTATAASVQLGQGSLKATIEDSGNFDSTLTPGLAYGGREFVSIGMPSSWYWFSAGGSELIAQYASNPFGAQTVAAGDSATTTGTAYGWSFSQTVSLSGPDQLTLRVSLTNETGAAVDDVMWGVGLDPDQDSYDYTPATLNRIVGVGAAAAVSAYGRYLGLEVTLANDVGAGASDVVAFSHVGDCCNAVAPQAAYAQGQALGWEQYGDDSISLAYRLGSVAAGQTVGLGYTYSFVSGVPTPPVPEPASAVMLLGGLALLGARRRRAG